MKSGIVKISIIFLSLAIFSGMLWPAVTSSAASTPELPTVTSVVPHNGALGATLTGVIINGTNLKGATAVTFSGTGVSASNLLVNDANTQITATVTISDDADFGARDVIVTTPSGNKTLSGGFIVVSPLPPTITSVLPNSDVQGATLAGVLIQGTNLTGVTAVNFSGTGVTAVILREFGAGADMCATFTISSDATIGARDMTVTTPAGTSSPLIGGFIVNANTGLPTVSIGVPATVPVGGTFDVNVNVSRLSNISAWQFDLQYDNTVFQIIGMEGGAAVTPGLVGTTTMPVDIWAFQPPGTPSGKIGVLGHVKVFGCISGSGYLDQIHFTVVGATGSHSSLHLANVILFDTGGGKRQLVTADGEVAVVNIHLGDADGDGVVSMGDVSKVQRIILGLDAPTAGSDANGDGVVNVGDVTKIERIILGFDSH